MNRCHFSHFTAVLFNTQTYCKCNTPLGFVITVFFLNEFDEFWPKQWVKSHIVSHCEESKCFALRRKSDIISGLTKSSRDEAWIYFILMKEPVFWQTYNMKNIKKMTAYWHLSSLIVE